MTSYVAPHVGAWIETCELDKSAPLVLSLPTWERGLKQKGDGQGGNGDYVAPHVGAWIETHRRLLSTVRETVAPHVGAWIETR